MKIEDIKIGETYYTTMHSNDWEYDLFTVNAIEENKNHTWFGAGYCKKYGNNVNKFVCMGAVRREYGVPATTYRFLPSLFKTFDDLKNHWHEAINNKKIITP